MKGKFTKRQLNLINLSLDIILNEGIQSLTIRNLSTRAGITEPAIYRHFKSKFDILYNLLDFFDIHSVEFIKVIREDSSDSIGKLKLFFLTHCKRFNENKAFAIIMFSEEIFGADIRLKKKLITIIEKQKRLLIELILEAQKNKLITENIPEEHIFVLLIGSLRFLVTEWKVSGFKKDLLKVGEAYWSSIEKILFLK